MRFSAFKNHHFSHWFIFER